MPHALEVITQDARVTLENAEQCPIRERDQKLADEAGKAPDTPGGAPHEVEIVASVVVGLIGRERLAAADPTTGGNLVAHKRHADLDTVKTAPGGLQAEIDLFAVQVVRIPQQADALENLALGHQSTAVDPVHYATTLERLEGPAQVRVSDEAAIQAAGRRDLVWLVVASHSWADNSNVWRLEWW